MSSWAGWQSQLLSAANLPGTSSNSAFLSDWNNSANSNCQNNPVDISRSATGATDCRPLTTSRTAKNYTSHAQAASTFAQQLQSGNFPHLFAALNSGTPYSVPSPHDVIADLILWGSASFAYMLSQNYGPPSGGGDGSVNIHAPQVLRGWKDVRHSAQTVMPEALRSSDKAIRRALQQLARARKVRA